jgi:hypothetical protein
LDALTKQALVIDSEVQQHNELVAMGDLVGGLWRRRFDSDPPSAVQSMANTSVESNPKPMGASFLYESAPGAKNEKPEPSIWNSARQKWRFGIIPAAALIAAGAVAMGFLRPSADEFPGSKKPLVVSEMSVAGEARSQNEATLQPQKPAPAEKNESAKPVDRAKPSARVRGAFEITRPTQVYSGPSEITLAIARIEPGTKINVIDSRDGWLEIRSKHGRPPGFIRQEAAVRINPERG